MKLSLKKLSGKFIGIKDSFGTKIYEGDIVSFENFENLREDNKILHHRVIYDSKLCCFCFGPIPIMNYIQHSNTQDKIIKVVKKHRCKLWRKKND